jgi:hypothetical protein
MKDAAASLHSDDARNKLPSQSNQRRAPRLTPYDDRARGIEARDAADVLADLDAKNQNVHSHSSF